MTRYPIPQPFIDSIEEQREFSEDPSPDYAPYDFSCAIDFLKQYGGNKATYDSYRREIERLLQWCWLIAQKSILDLKRQDIEQYIAFCLKPPKSWVGIKRVARFLTRGGERKVNPHWRPFVATVSKAEHKNGIIPDKSTYHLSQKAIREIFTVLGSFYTYLVQDEKIASNPVALVKQKSKYLQTQQTQRAVMRLSDLQWQSCLKKTTELAEQFPETHERTLFMLSAMYFMYLRISELAANERWIPQMNHFYQDSGSNWWFKTVGKGNKMREIAVSDAMLAALMRYRTKMQLSPLPSPNENTPLIPKEKGTGAMSSTRRIRLLIQSCFDKTIQELRNRELVNEADSLETATVHWLRHTGISDAINKQHRPIAHVRDDAGHSSSAITDRYNDIELRERHQSANNKLQTSTEE